MQNQSKILKIAAPALDERMKRTLRLFFLGPCQNTVVFAENSAARAALIDIDAIGAEALLNEQQATYPQRIIVLLSLTEQQRPGTIWLKKPVQIQEMLRVLDTVRRQIADTMAIDEPAAAAEPTKIVLAADRPRRRAHETALLLDEQGFGNFLGTLPDVDPYNTEQRDAVYYDPKRYLQGYIQAAYKHALQQDRILRINTSAQPIIVFPHSREIWIDINDDDLREQCVIPVQTSRNGAGLTVSPLSTEEVRKADHSLEKFQGMEAFLWKLALWASSGRAPEGIDLDQPVYLRRWPNLTRFVNPPHALRIAALMVEQPRSLISVAERLNTSPAYVFAFFSAACALGLAGQAKRRIDHPAPRPESPPRRKHQGMLSRILGYLRRH